MKKPNKKKHPYVIVRCRDAGVHCGEYVSHSGREVRLQNSRRIYYWSGAATLSEIAVHGCKKPQECKITVAVEAVTLLEASEILACSYDGEKFLREISAWRA